MAARAAPSACGEDESNLLIERARAAIRRAWDVDIGRSAAACESRIEASKTARS